MVVMRTDQGDGYGACETNIGLVQAGEGAGVVIM